jgi:DNA-binding XRE family transcriptional regulator
MARGTRRARLNLGLASRRVAASQINEIRERVRAGASQRSLAAAYGLSKSTIGNIVHGREWYGEAV